MESKTSRSNPRVTAARTARYASSRSASRSFNIERPPIIIEIGSSVVRVGFAENFKPQHIFPFVSKTIERSQRGSETQWYSILSPIIDETYDRLMVNPSTRRVVCVHSHYPERALVAALQQILWNRGVPALCFVSGLEMLPVALGWKRGMIVQVGSDEAVCVAHVDGHILPYTYQSVPCGYKSVLDDDAKIQRDWNSTMDQLFLDERNPSSLVFGVLKCLEASPRDTLVYVVSNIVFCGEAILLFPDLPRRVGKKIRALLEGTTEQLEATADRSEASEQKEEKVDETQLTSVPIRIDTLRPLADRLAVTSSAPYRPDLISWTGTSLWAAVWYKYDGEETRFSWTFAPTE